MKRSGILLLTALLTAVLAAPAWAGGEAGSVESLSGRVLVTRAGVVNVLRVQSELRVGDQVRTGVDGRVRIRFIDDSTMTVAPNSNIEIAEFMFESQQSRVANFRLMAGRVRARVSSALTQDSNVRITTPTAVAGVRGTDFMVSTGEGDGDGDGDTYTEVTVFSGSVGVSDAEGGSEVTLGPGMRTRVGKNQPPEDPSNVPPEELQQNQEESGDDIDQDDSSERASGSVDLEEETQVLDERTGEQGRDDSQTRRGADDDGDQPDVKERTSANPPPILQQPTDRRDTAPVTIEIRRQR
jgi:hypothetical protein